MQQTPEGHYHFRAASHSDIGKLVMLWQNIDTLGEPRPFGGDTIDKPVQAKTIIEHNLKSTSATILVCTVKNHIIATIAGHLFDKAAVYHSPVGVIYSLWVDQEHRKQGIARALLQRLEDALKKMGAKALQVGWDTPNIEAAKWWQAQGYKPYEVIASKNLTDC